MAWTGRIGVALFLTGLLVSQPQAAELVMFDSPVCGYCEQWDEEISAIYPLTKEGQRAPLRRVSVHDPLPDDLNQIHAIIYTPTFVLVDAGQEIGRISGYPGEDFFWGFLETLIAQLPKPAAACNRPDESSSTQTGRLNIC